MSNRGTKVAKLFDGVGTPKWALNLSRLEDLYLATYRMVGLGFFVG